MNQQNAHLYLPHVQALAEQKTIEVVDANGVWKIHDDLKFDEPADHYRAKEPEPEVQTAGQVAKHAFGICQGSMDESWEAAAQAVIAHHEANKPRVEADQEWWDLVPGVDTWQSEDEWRDDPSNADWRRCLQSMVGRVVQSTHAKGRRRVAAQKVAVPQRELPPWERNDWEARTLIQKAQMTVEWQRDHPEALIMEAPTFSPKAECPAGYHLATEAELDKLPANSKFLIGKSTWARSGFSGNRVPDKARIESPYYACPDLPEWTPPVAPISSAPSVQALQDPLITWEPPRAA